MLIAKNKIQSYLRGRKVYALQGDKVLHLCTSGEVGCYRNLETNETFPTKTENISDLPDDVIFPKERDIPIEKKSKVKYNPNQISLF